MYKILLIAAVILNVAAQAILKIGMSKHKLEFGQGVLEFTKEVFSNYLFWGSLVFYGLGFLLYAIVLSKLELSTAYPVSSTLAIILTVLVSAVVIHEPLGAYKIMGLGLCLAGVFIIFR